MDFLGFHTVFPTFHECHKCIHICQTILIGGTQLKSTGTKSMEVKVNSDAPVDKTAVIEETPMSDDEGLFFLVHLFSHCLCYYKNWTRSIAGWKYKFKLMLF